jgi:hypothetical protein
MNPDWGVAALAVASEVRWSSQHRPQMSSSPIGLLVTFVEVYTMNWPNIQIIRLCLQDYPAPFTLPSLLLKMAAETLFDLNTSDTYAYLTDSA